jgi:valyl-tRNA synthetase
VITPCRTSKIPSQSSYKLLRSSNKMELDRKPDFKKLEEKWQKAWIKSKIYKFDPKSKKPVYSIDSPPVTISGASIHMGHSFSYTHFDVIARYKRMMGFNVLVPIGFDNNGQPTERFVEKKYKIDSNKIERAEFNKLVHKEIPTYEKKYKKDLIRLGHSYDWSLAYQTISKHSAKTAQLSFLDLYKKKHVYRAEEPTIWCTSCQTALSQADVEDSQRKTKLNWIYFELEDGKKVEIATTRPEFLSACVGVFVNPKDKRYNHLIGKRAKVPMFNYWVPILTDDDVDMKFGSGMMMVCTFGDSADIEKWKKHKLALKMCITKEGRMSDISNKYKGLTIKQARAASIEDLQGWDYLIKQEDKEQTVGVCWRCGTPAEFTVTKQWFVELLSNKEQFIKQGKKVKWHPEFYRKRYEDWITNLGWDWIISRQRHFGIPIPVWYCKDCGLPTLPSEKDLPIEPTTSKPKGKCSCGSNQFVPETDVFDTWFTSSMTPELVLGWAKSDSKFKRYFPEDLRPSAHDIIRTWAFYTIVKAWYHFEKIPWKNVMISGFALAPDGRAMHKSWGNAIPPMDIVEKYNADALRYWANTTRFGDDVAVKDQDLIRGSKLLIKLWNSSRFIAMNLQGAPKKKPILEFADQWILSRLAEVSAEYQKQFDSYQPSKAKRAVENFFYAEFCDFYLEMIKYRTYGDDKNSKQAAQWTLNSCLLEILKMFAPIIPHVTEEIYDKLYKKQVGVKSIHITEFAKNLKADKEAIKLGTEACSIISEIRQHKQKQGMSMGKELESYKLAKKPKDWKKIELLVKKTMRVQKIE